MRTTNHNRPCGLLGFRLDLITWNVLAGEAARQGVNPVELAKSYVIRGVHERAARDALVGEIRLLREEISRLRAQHPFDESAACQAGLVRSAEPGIGTSQLRLPHRQE